MSTTTTDPIDGGRKPFKGWVKIAATVAIVVALLALLFGLRHVVIFGKEAPPPAPQVVRAATSTPWPGLPPEAAPVQLAIAPAPQQAPPPAQERSLTQRGPSPLTSDILGIAPAQSATSGGSAERVAAREAPDGSGRSNDALAASLRPTELAGSRVTELPNPNYLVSNGRLLSCKQTTASSTEHPGGVVAEIDKDVRGDTGTVTVLDKGAKLFGTIQTATANGGETAFVLWQNITTIPLYDRYRIPHEYRIEVDSAATTEAGETGMPGDVDRHWRTKIPALIGVSLLSALPQAASAFAGQGRGNNNLSLNFMQAGTQGVQSAADAWLGRLLNVPDVIRRLQGTSCGVLLMRDLDMKAAYQLRNAR